MTILLFDRKEADLTSLHKFKFSNYFIIGVVQGNMDVRSYPGIWITFALTELNYLSHINYALPNYVAVFRHVMAS
jgi:hypothetical protein